MNAVKTLRVTLLLGIKKTLLPQTTFVQRVILKVDHGSPLLAKYQGKKRKKKKGIGTVELQTPTLSRHFLERRL